MSIRVNNFVSLHIPVLHYLSSEWEAQTCQCTYAADLMLYYSLWNLQWNPLIPAIKKLNLIKIQYRLYAFVMRYWTSMFLLNKTYCSFILVMARTACITNTHITRQKQVAPHTQCSMKDSNKNIQCRRRLRWQFTVLCKADEDKAHTKIYQWL